MGFDYFNKHKKNNYNNKKVNDNDLELVEKAQEEQAMQFSNEFNKNEEKVQEPKTNEELLAEVHKAAIVAEVKNNDETKGKIMDQAKRTIDQSIQELDNKNNLKVQNAVYNANSEACRCYGIEDSVPVWQVKLMAAGHAVWFVIYFIFASVTFCPINVFVKGIKSFVKNAWLAVLFGVICYLVIVIGIPLILSLVKK